MGLVEDFRDICDKACSTEGFEDKQHVLGAVPISAVGMCGESGRERGQGPSRFFVDI